MDSGGEQMNKSHEQVEDDKNVQDSTESFQDMSITPIDFVPSAESSKLSNMSTESVNANNESLKENHGAVENPSGFEAVQQILKNCSPDLSEYLEKCQKAKICNSCIKTLTRDDVSALFDQEIGIRGIFFDSLEKYRGKLEVKPKSDVIKKNANHVAHKNGSRVSSTDYKKFDLWKKVVSL